MVALDKQFVRHHGTKPRSCGRWRNESWQTGKSPGHRTAEILPARSHRDTSSSSNTSCANEIIYCGYRFDPETQLYYVRNRTHNPVLGRWIQRDPIGYAGGINLYEYVESGPVGMVDPWGLIPTRPPGPFPADVLPTVPRGKLAETFGWDLHQGATTKSFGKWTAIPGETKYTVSVTTCPPLWQKWVKQTQNIYTSTRFSFSRTKRFGDGFAAGADTFPVFGGLGEPGRAISFYLGYIDLINLWEVHFPDGRPKSFTEIEYQGARTRWVPDGPPVPMPTP